MTGMLLRKIYPDILSLSDFSVFIDAPLEEATRRLESRDKHRGDPEYFARKRFVTEKYDVPYFEANKKNVSLIIEGEDVVLNKIAEERDTKNAKFLDHGKTWYN